MTSSRRRLLALAAACLFSVACGDLFDSLNPSPTPSPTPTPSPAPTPGAANVRIENFTATYTPAPNGTYTYRVAFTLRESGGTGATLSTVTMTLTQSTGATAATDYTAQETFGTTRLAANGTLPSNPVAFTGPPVAASQLAVRVVFTDDTGRAGAAQATTAVTAAP
jgi:hypothetical protein